MMELTEGTIRSLLVLATTIAGLLGAGGLHLNGSANTEAADAQRILGVNFMIDQVNRAQANNRELFDRLNACRAQQSHPSAGSAPPRP